jgi:deoxyribodipyrimidine photo-lyase
MLVWFRSDLRLSDHPALHFAVRSKQPIVCLYVYSPQIHLGTASRFWLSHSLHALSQEIRTAGGHLLIRTGDPLKIIPEVVHQANIRTVVWNTHYEPLLLEEEKKITAWLAQHGIAAKAFPGNLLFPPGEIGDTKGRPYQVFSFFWKGIQKHPGPEKPIPAVHQIHSAKLSMATEDPLETILPKTSWAKQLEKFWKPGSLSAHARWRYFLKENYKTYETQRDFPKEQGTSLLSASLHFGEISPREMWHAIPSLTSCFAKELCWRDFAIHMLLGFPKMQTVALKEKFRHFPWKENDRFLHAWQEGKTGYPLVDAGMRQLKQIGWMHNRVRMVTASFLVKHLLQPWQRGEAWFWEYLVDADLANNAMNWQWCAGSGPDAAPYFRIFNPTAQAGKFDPQQEYIRTYVPEIGTSSYPKPIVDQACASALAAFSTI